jgi:hypothetical protein
MTVLVTRSGTTAGLKIWTPSGGYEDCGSGTISDNVFTTYFWGSNPLGSGGGSFVLLYNAVHDAANWGKSNMIWPARIDSKTLSKDIPSGGSPSISGDINSDGIVDLRDFAGLADHWLVTVSDPNNPAVP